MTFDELNLAPAILKAVREQGYTEPTAVQAQAIPAVLQGRDLLAGAQTGTGKTAAFTLPMLHRLCMARSSTNRFGGTGVRALVLTPTRELAAQVEEAIRTYGTHLQLSTAVIFGGVGQNPQIERLRSGVDILVATPGRLLDLNQQGHVDLSTVQMLVLDEADRMLDMGFIHDVRKVLALLPAQKQSLLFSATFSDEIRTLAATLLRDPMHIQVTPRNTTVQRIVQSVHPVGRAKKSALLAHIIETHGWSQVLVFTRTKFGANSVADFLNSKGIQALALHGNKSQGARTQALEGFRSGELRALVATDIAARGIDIEDLPHVVNYDIPNVPEDYVHRIGRTGRAGREGQAISLVSLDEEGFMAEIERFTRQSIPVEPIPGFGPEPDEKAEPIAMGRQVLWGGAGKAPGREVMAAAARAARQQMQQRIRDNAAAQGGRGSGSNGPGGQARAARAESAPGGAARAGKAKRRGQGPGRPEPTRQTPRPRRDDPLQRTHPAAPMVGLDQDDDADDRMPRNVDPLKTTQFARRHEHRPPARGPAGQPDPTRTSIDSLGAGGRRGGGGGAGGGGGRHHGSRSAGFGGGSGGGRRSGR